MKGEDSRLVLYLLLWTDLLLSNEVVLLSANSPVDDINILNPQLTLLTSYTIPDQN
jgi:hypothetical protein